MKSTYIQYLEDAIANAHGVISLHRETVKVRQSFDDHFIWEGDVEVFELKDHKSATACYAWRDKRAGGRWHPILVLHAPPVTSPATAIVKYYESKLTDDRPGPAPSISDSRSPP